MRPLLSPAPEGVRSSLPCSIVPVPRRPRPTSRARARPAPARGPHGPRLRGADADPARGDPAAARRDATCSARPRPAPARPRRSRCRCCSASTTRRAARATAPRALVLVPTRELAMQVAEAVHQLRRRRSASRVAADLRRRADAARRSARSRRGVDVVVATPGRALDHIRRGTLQLAALARASCSTRPTRCSTWASPRTSRRSSRRRRPSGRRRSSRRRCRRASRRSPSAT